MVTLVIVSIGLVAATSMITKQIKQENSASVYRNIIIRRIDSAISQGAVMFFYNSSCPNGQHAIDNIAGRYIGFRTNTNEIGSTYAAFLPNIKGVFQEQDNFTKTLDLLVIIQKQIQPNKMKA